MMSAIEKLIQKCEVKVKTGKELPKLDVGTPVLYDKNPDSTKIKRPWWVKGLLKIGKILASMKF